MRNLSSRDSQKSLARRTSELFEPGYDPYNSLPHYRAKNSIPDWLPFGDPPRYTPTIDERAEYHPSETKLWGLETDPMMDQDEEDEE